MYMYFGTKNRFFHTHYKLRLDSYTFNHGNVRMHTLPSFGTYGPAELFVGAANPKNDTIFIRTKKAPHTEKK